MSRELQVKVNQSTTGQLIAEGAEYIFNYSNDAVEQDFVSLTMPVRRKSYLHNQLHPVFEMQLPEGYLRSVIQKHFAKLTETDDFGLLQLLAPYIKGRLSYSGHDSTDRPPLQLDDLLHPKKQNLFAELVDRFAFRSALSGVQPKILAEVENKATLTLDQYIVKAWGSDYPELALNEYICMTAVKLAGLPVPEFYLSEDRSLFIMKRFDICADGTYLGFEDLGVLHGKGRDQKYTGSYESVAKSLLTFLSPQHRQQSMEQYFQMLVLNTLLQNGDAHLKNFAILYSDIKDIRLAPVYDVVSTSFYIANDIAALTLLGSKKWWSRKYLLQFAQNHCEISKDKADALFDQCLAALDKMRGLISEMDKDVHSESGTQLLAHFSSLIDTHLTELHQK